MNWYAFTSGIPVRCRVTALAVVPNSQTSGTVYAGTMDRRGIFKTTDGGASWHPVNNGLVGSQYAYGYLPSIYAIAIHPQNPDIVFAGTDEGVYKSTDAGMNWEPFRDGMPDRFVYSLAFDPQNPGKLYAATQGGGIFEITLDLN
jgi:hypothetical protein